MNGRIRVKKCLVSENGSPEYEKIANDPLVTVLDEKDFNSFDKFYKVVTYEDMRPYNELAEESDTSDAT